MKKTIKELFYKLKRKKPRFSIADETFYSVLPSALRKIIQYIAKRLTEPEVRSRSMQVCPRVRATFDS